MLKHIFLNFCCMKIQCDDFYFFIIFLIFERLGRMQKNKTFFFLLQYFQRKLGVLMPDLYLYGIKIQTNIYRKYMENHKFFKGFFLEFLEFF